MRPGEDKAVPRVIYKSIEFESSDMSWEEHEAAAASLGGSLASILNAEQNEHYVMLSGQETLSCA